MSRQSCDGPGLLAAFRAAVANLEAHVDEINALNVFPVPDGDTGSNMVATVRVALEEAEGAAGQPAERIAAAISFGALMGARGNSGVITSQILSGMARGLAHKRRFNGLDLAHCLGLGTETAYAAVKKPVEGTILTVVREAAGAARIAAENDDDIESVLTAAVAAAERAVARTPTLLPVLREAGVVDSGGQGLLRLFQGALGYVTAGARPRPPARRPADARPTTLVAHADQGFGYETMFLVQPIPGRDLDIDAIRARLEVVGESVVVAGDAKAAKIHVHSGRPDEVLAFGLGLGSLSRISVENLDHQARDVRERKASEFTGAEAGAEADRPLDRSQGDGRGLDDGRSRGRGRGAGNGHAKAVASRTDQRDASSGSVAVAAPAVPGASAAVAGLDDGRTTFATGAREGPRMPLAVVAVAAGEGLASIFGSFGVAAVVRGGQAANPSTGELLAAVEALSADEVLILPNNPNVILAARQVAAMARVPVDVVPTRNAAEGFAALLALDPTAGGAANVAGMTERAREIATLQVTTAVRDARIGDRKVKKGQAIVLDPDDGLVAVDGDRDRAILAAVATLPQGTELITLFYGDDADLDEAEHVARLIAEARPEVEVEVRHGGQPHYRYLLSAE